MYSRSLVKPILEEFVGLYRALLHGYLAGGEKFWKRPYLLHALIATGLGATHLVSEVLATEQLEPDVRNLIEQIGKRGGVTSIRAIDHMVSAWKRGKAKKRWAQLAKRWLRSPWTRLVRASVILVIALASLVFVEEMVWGKLGLVSLFKGAKAEDPSNGQKSQPPPVKPKAENGREPK